MARVIYISNDNLLELDGLQKASDDSYVNDADVTVTLKDASGDPVSGQTWPATLSYVAGSNGKYQATLEDGLSLTVGGVYTAEIDADAGSDLLGHWEVVAEAKTRGSI